MQEVLEIGGGPLAVRLAGEEGAPAILALHGLGADSGRMAAGLGPLEGFGLILPDMPGHGASPLRATAGFGEFATLCLKLLDRLGLERVRIVGLSMGSGIALRCALEAPERVAGLILIRPSWLDQAHPPHLEALARIGGWQASGEDAAALLEADPDYLALAAENPGAAESLRSLLTRPQAREAASVLGAMIADRPFDELDRLAAIRAPALILVNEGDPLHPPEIGESLARALPRAGLTSLPSRYLEPEAHEKALRAEIRKFLAETGDA